MKITLALEITIDTDIEPLAIPKNTGGFILTIHESDLTREIHQVLDDWVYEITGLTDVEGIAPENTLRIVTTAGEWIE